MRRQKHRNIFRKLSRTGISCCLVGMLLSGCQPPDGAARSSAENQVRVALSKADEPEYGLDPTYGWGHGGSPLVQSTLLRYGSHRQVVNDVARDHKISDDGYFMEFWLRDDVKFTDGQPLEADDVAFTFEQAKAHQAFVDLNIVQDIIVIEPHRLQIRLREPQLTFLHTVAMLGIIPKHAYNQGYALHPIGSGPFKLLEWHRGEQMVLETNRDYYEQTPLISKAVLLFMDEDAAFAAAQSGQVDVALTSPASASDGQQTQELSAMRLVDLSTVDNRGMTLPLSADQGQKTESGLPIGNNITSDKAVRQALAYGINREKIVKDALNGYGSPAFSENDGMPWNNPEVRISEDQSRARRILEEGGWILGPDGIAAKDGRRAEFSCLYPAGDQLRQAIAAAAAQQAEALGIKINIHGMSWPDIRKKMFSEAVLMGWGSSDPSLSIMLFHGKNKWQDDYYNPEGFDDPAVNSYLEQAVAAKTQEEMHDLLKKAQWDGSVGTSMRAGVPWLWLVNAHHLYYVREGLDIGDQGLHGHGASWSLVANLRDWSWPR